MQTQTQTKLQNIHQKFNQPENQVRLAIMDFILDHQRPFNLNTDGYAALKGITLSQEKDFPQITHTLQQRDGMVVDQEGNVNFIYPVSALPTSHHVRLADGREFTAMCAIDAIGAAFTFRQDTQVTSQCCVCGHQVHLRVQDGQIVEHSPQDLHALSFILSEISNWAGSC